MFLCLQFKASGIASIDVKKLTHRGKIFCKSKESVKLKLTRSLKQYRTFTYKASRYGKPFVYRWSAEEVRLATGNVEVTHLQHHLKLGSAYLGVPGSHRTRDRCGEPLATSYHSKFLGTVDYIWYFIQFYKAQILLFTCIYFCLLKSPGGKAQGIQRTLFQSEFLKLYPSTY